MGMADETRFNGVINIVNDMYKIDRFTIYGFNRLNKHLDNLWYHFLKDTTCSDYWLYGGTSNTISFQKPSLLWSAFQTVLHEYETKKKGQQPWESPNEDDRNKYRLIDITRPNAKKILHSKEYDGKEMSNAWELFELVERYYNFANRYNDKWKNKYPKLKKTITTIHGILFDLIQNNEEFFKAFLMEKILNKCVPYDKDDIVTNIWLDNNLYHSIKINVIELNDLFNYFKLIQTKSNQYWNANRRLEIVNKLTFDRAYYKHQLNVNISKIEEWNKVNPKDQINIEKIKRDHKCYEILCNKKKSKYKTHHYCILTDQRIDY